MFYFNDRIVDSRDVMADCSVDVRDIELGLKECTYRMTIPSTDLSDTGTYTVKVKNKHGSAESSVSIARIKIFCCLENRFLKSEPSYI